MDGAARAIPLGVTLRRNRAGYVTRHWPSASYSTPIRLRSLSGVVAAGAAAASCFGQSGKDLIAGVVEIVEPAASLLGPGATGETKPWDLIQSSERWPARSG